MRFLIVLTLLFAMISPVRAQTKYSTWSKPNRGPGPGTTRDMIKRLDKLIDAAEKARAADPAFLRDLRDLARSYDAAASLPANRTVLSDDFADGDFTANPVWTVSTGRYWVERGWGLRSAISVVDPNQQQQQQPSKKDRNRDAAIALLGAMLGSIRRRRHGDHHRHHRAGKSRYLFPGGDRQRLRPGSGILLLG